MVSCLNNRLPKIVWDSCERRSAFIEFRFGEWRSTGTEAVSRSRRFTNPMSSHDTTQPNCALYRLLEARKRPKHRLFRRTNVAASITCATTRRSGVWYGAGKACCPPWPPIYIALGCRPERVLRVVTLSLSGKKPTRQCLSGSRALETSGAMRSRGGRLARAAGCLVAVAGGLF